MQFHDIELSDREWISELYAVSNYQASEYSFSNSYNWREVYGIQAARVDDYVCIRCTKPGITYLYPAGSGDIAPVIEALMQDARDNGVDFYLYGILDQEKNRLEQLFPNRFDFTLDRDYCDYIYERESLLTLSGKKLHSKRNHIHRFKEDHPDWQYEQITSDNIDDVWKMNVEWCNQYGCAENTGLALERCAVQNAFENFEALGLQGGLIRTQGKVIAYSIGKPLNDDTFIVHIEKAFHEIQGAYPIINQQFVEHNCQGFSYINREDDTGAENLRKAKLSYHPAILLSKYHAVLK